MSASILQTQTLILVEMTKNTMTNVWRLDHSEIIMMIKNVAGKEYVFELACFVCREEACPSE